MTPAQCTFNGLPFNQPSSEFYAWTDKYIALTDYQRLLDYPTRPSPRIQAINFPWHSIRRGFLRLNRLLYPWGLSNWAEFNGIIDEDVYQELMTLQTEDDNDPLYDLIISDSLNTLTVSMTFLPPRPLPKVQGEDGFYLLTLVDERYGFQGVGMDAFVITSGTTTWTDAINAVADALSIGITLDTINANYGTGPSGDSMLNSLYDSAVLIGDALAENRVFRF